MDQQETMWFIETDHSQGLPPLGVKVTAPVPFQRKRSHVIKGRYAYSIKTSRVKEPDFPYTGKRLRCTTDLLDFARSLQEADIEKMLAVFLDAQNQVIGIHITNGTISQAVVYPREIVRHAILAGACAVILIHNHPSGQPRPSDADIRLTKTVTDVGKFLDLMVHDHIIIGTAERFFSFREEGLM